MAARQVAVAFSELYIKAGIGPQLFRCESCKAATDDVDGHAAWHAVLALVLVPLGTVVKVAGTGQRVIPVDAVTVKVDVQ